MDCQRFFSLGHAQSQTGEGPIRRSAADPKCRSRGCREQVRRSAKNRLDDSRRRSPAHDPKPSFVAAAEPVEMGRKLPVRFGVHSWPKPPLRSVDCSAATDPMRPPGNRSHEPETARSAPSRHRIFAPISVSRRDQRPVRDLHATFGRSARENAHRIDRSRCSEIATVAKSITARTAGVLRRSR